MKTRQRNIHMKVAHLYSELSYSNKMKVGCILISPSGDRVMSIGYNGTPPGWDNCCETPEGITKDEVIHAEANCLDKLYTTSDSAKQGYMFCTHSPCKNCAERIANAKIKHFFYTTPYRDQKPIDYLIKRGVKVTKLKLKR